MPEAAPPPSVPVSSFDHDHDHGHGPQSRSALSLARIDLHAGRCDALVPDEGIERRRRELPAPTVPPSQSPWEEMYRSHTGQLVDGATLDTALKYRRIAERAPRHNH